MKQTEQLIGALKLKIRAKGMTYKELALGLGLSESNLKRAFSKGLFTLARLEEICDLLEIDFYELAKTAKGRAQDVSPTFNLVQEKALALDPELFTFFYLILSGWSPKKITSKYDFSGSSEKYLLVLDKLNLIELHENNKLKLLVTQNVRWLTRGPLNEKYEVQIKKEFLDSSFLSKNEKMRLLSGRFSESAIRHFTQKIEKLLGEFLELSDSSLESTQSQHLWMLVAYRPWIFSVAAKYEKRRY